MEKYKNYDINLLIKACREHDESAFLELLTRYNPMINKLVGSFTGSAFDKDDLCSEAVIALHSAVMRFDTEQDEVTFGLFAGVCIRNRLVDYFRRESPRSDICDIDIDTLPDGEEIVEGIVKRETVSTLLKKAECALSDYEFRVLMLHIQGYKTSAIAKSLGRSAKSVDNAKSRLFRRLREELSGDGII